MINLERQKRAHELFKRYAGNPILTTHDWPYAVNAVFNPGAVSIDGVTLLLVRAEDMRGFSHLTVARSSDGLTKWKVDPSPTFEADHDSREERWGVEDPRIIWLEASSHFARRFCWVFQAATRLSIVAR